MGAIVSQTTSLTIVNLTVYWDRRRSKKTSKLRVTSLCAENSPGTGEYHAQIAINAENVSISWRHHEIFVKKGNFPIINIPADGLAQSGAKTSEGAVMITIQACVCQGVCYSPEEHPLSLSVVLRVLRYLTVRETLWYIIHQYLMRMSAIMKQTVDIMGLVWHMVSLDKDTVKA